MTNFLDGRQKCAGLTDLFTPDEELESYDDRQERLEAARFICGSCPLLEACRDWGLTQREEGGVWGGLSETERAEIWRQEDLAAGRPARVTPIVDEPEPGQERPLWAWIDELQSRHLDTLGAVSEGHVTDQQVARYLGVSVKTAQNYAGQIRVLTGHTLESAASAARAAGALL